MVIAIIGVLAAVLIPTFSGAIDSARQASDKSDVTHMNQELMIYKIQENVSSVDYHSALLWLTTNGYSLESSAKGYAYWFDEEAEQLVYAQVDDAVNGTVASAAGDEDGFLDDPGKIAKHQNLTLIDRRTDNPVIAAVNGVRNLVQTASSAGSAAGDINAKLAKSFEEIVNAAGNETVKTYLNNFAPDKTLYITENGVYTAVTDSATAVVFSDTLRIIHKSTTGSPNYPVANDAVIELPKTVALVMEGSLSGIVPVSGGEVKITAEKAQFMKDSLSPAVEEASDIKTIEVPEVTGGSISFEVEYTYKEAVIEFQKGGKTMQQTVRVKLSDPEQADSALTGATADYESGLTADAANPKVLREYLVPTFTFNGSFANVSGIDVQMKKDGDLVVFYGITYGKNGTISQVVTFGYWTNINEGVQDHRDDTQPDVTVEYQYTVTDPLRGYDFGEFYPELKVKAFYEEEGEEKPVELTQNLAGGDTVYRSADYYAQKPDKFTVSMQHDEADLVIYAEYVQ